MKPFSVSSLPIAVTFVALSGSVLAFSQQSNPTQLMSGHAALDKTLDTKSAMQGQMISAKLTDSIQTPEGFKLPSGTELMGHVDQVQASKDKSEAKLSLTFDKAHLKDGKVVPIKATIMEVNAPGTIGEVTTKVASDDKFDQETATSGETLHSAVQADNSGTLVRTDKDIRLPNGTELLVAVEPAS